MTWNIALQAKNKFEGLGDIIVRIMGQLPVPITAEETAREGCDADRRSGRLHTIPTALAHVVSERSPLRSAAYYPCSDQNR